jgi:hypothetical protein
VAYLMVGGLTSHEVVASASSSVTSAVVAFVQAVRFLNSIVA